MERHFKIFLLTFLGLVFPCLSFAIPDLYFFNNHLIGMSPYSIKTGDYTFNSNGLWESYNGSTANGYSNGLVVSFSQKKMSGTNPVSAVTAVNMDNLTGFYYELPAGHATLIYSGTGSLESVTTSVNIDGYCLGFTRPDGDARANGYGHTFVRKNGSFYASVPNSFTPSELTGKQFTGSKRTDWGLGFKSSATHNPYSSSMVWLLVNRSSDTVKVYPSGSTFENYNKYPYSIDTISIDSLNWNFVIGNSLQSITSASYTWIWGFPDIRGDIDLYSCYYESKSYSSFYIKCFYDVDITFSALDADYLSNLTVTRYNDSLLQVVNQKSVITEFIPAFLHAYSSSPFVSSERIIINSGEISIDNYDELIRKLQEAGFGGGGSGGDLTSVIALLEQIQSGGVTGEEVKQLIDTLESYHQQLVNNADFDSVTNVFDSYKNLLDFSDDMHWLITANNALFGYFAGFIMLCAMFLILNRIMR